MYPHRIEQFVIVVPTEFREYSEMLNILIKSPLINVWPPTIILFTICHKLIYSLLPRGKNKSAIHIFFESIGISFGATSPSFYINRSQNVLGLFLTIFSMSASITLSGYLFQQFTATSHMPTIITLNDLSENNHLNVYIPSSFRDTMLGLNNEFKLIVN